MPSSPAATLPSSYSPRSEIDRDPNARGANNSDPPSEPPISSSSSFSPASEQMQVQEPTKANDKDNKSEMNDNDHADPMEQGPSSFSSSSSLDKNRKHLKSQQLRLEANRAFESHDWNSALSLYTLAIERLTEEEKEQGHAQHGDPGDKPLLDNDNPSIRLLLDEDNESGTNKDLMIILLCNRSLCLYKMNLLEESKIDAQQAWDLSEHSSPKAAFRLAKAFLALKEYSNAIHLLQAFVPKYAKNRDDHQLDETRDRRIGGFDGNNHNVSRPSSEISNQPRRPDATAESPQVFHQDLVKLLQVAYEHYLREKNIPDAALLSKLTSIIQPPQSLQSVEDRSSSHRLGGSSCPAYIPSIRHFEKVQLLGEGNYSQVYAVRHIVTREEFALKILDKSRVQQLAKRQHPNVYNEIEMEKRVLGRRLVVSMDSQKKLDQNLSSCLLEGAKRIVRLYYTFQDYNHLYYLMDLPSRGFGGGGDLWSTLRFRTKMVGTYPTLAKVHLGQLLQALEFIHARGVVHRDLKAENLLLDDRGHLVLIDFGTAKDLIERDHNGPEFVGTPDFMAPEILGGPAKKSDKKKKKRDKRRNKNVKKDESTSNNHKLDDDDDDEEKEEEEKLEQVDYASQGKIGGVDHTLDLWSFGCVAYQILTGTTPFASPSQYLSFLKIQRGLLCRPMGIVDDDAWDLITRLMKLNPRERLGAECFEYVAGKNGEMNRMVQRGQGYDRIWNHPYFSDFNKYLAREKIRPIPTLRDLCIRACAELVENDAKNLDIDKDHPPGDNSSHDMLRLNNKDRGRVMDFLDRMRLLSQPRIFRRFFKTKQEARLGKVRDNTRDFIGLTQINDKQYQFPMKDSENMDEERSDVIETLFPIRYMHVSNPLFDKDVNDSCSDDERKKHIASLKESLKLVNKTRPKIIIASGYLDDECRKLMGKVNESIPVALNDGASFYAFWSCGGQGLVLRSSDFLGVDTKAAKTCDQAMWLKQELEQSRMTRHHVFAFVDCNPEKLPRWLIELLTKGRTLCLFGTQNQNCVIEKEFIYSDTKVDDDLCDMDTDDESVSSLESDIENQDYTMKIIIRGDASLRCWQLEEYGQWKFENI